MKKKKVWSSISRIAFALMFISSWVVLGISFALTNVTVKLSGGISFTATGIHATITGKVSDVVGESITEKQTLDTIRIDAETPEGYTAPESWENLNLAFKDAKSGLQVSFTIKNEASDRSLYVSFTDRITTNNTTVTRKEGETKKTNGFEECEIETGQEQTFTIDLTIENANKSVNDTFDLDIALSNEQSAIKDVDDPEYSVFSFTDEDASAKTIKISKGTTDPTGAVTIPSQVKKEGVVYTVTEIASEGFKQCTGITSVIIPSSVTKMGTYAFQSCGLTSLNIPSSLQEVSDHAFYLCVNLKSVVISEGVEKLSSSAFSQCSTLESVTLPQTLTSIGGFAFYNARKLTSIIIPENVKTIESNAFSSCSSLVSVEFKGLEGHTWKAGGTDVTTDIADKGKAATYLTTDYLSVSWTRT